MLSRTFKTEENLGNFLKFAVIPAISLSLITEIVGLYQQNTDIVLGSMLRATSIAGVALIIKLGLDLKDKYLNHMDKKKENNLQINNFNLN